MILLRAAEFIMTLSRGLHWLGEGLYNRSKRGYVPIRKRFDHDNPDWSPGFYEALGRDEWRRRRDEHRKLRS